jgi:hypothetical protein
VQIIQGSLFQLFLRDWAKIFEPYAVEKREILYDTFKGSRNLKDRSNKVVEIMYIITKKHEDTSVKNIVILQ